MSTNRTPKPPAGTRAGGRQLWESITKDYELEQHELALLVEAVRTVDLLDELDAAVRRDGAIVESPQGTKAHPAAVEARQQRIALARLLAALRMPTGAEDERPADSLTRPQRKSGARGVYSIRGVK